MIRVSIVVKDIRDREIVEGIGTSVLKEPFRLTPRIPSRNELDAPLYWFADVLLDQSQLLALVARASDIAAIASLAWAARVDDAQTVAADFKTVVAQADGTSKFVRVGEIPPELAAWAALTYDKTAGQR
ncbi:hypothetical protein [Microcystis phage Mae-JY24]